MYKKTQTIFETAKEDLTGLNEYVKIIEEVKDGQKEILSCRCKKCGHESTTPELKIQGREKQGLTTQTRSTVD